MSNNIIHLRPRTQQVDINFPKLPNGGYISINYLMLAVFGMKEAVLITRLQELLEAFGERRIGYIWVRLTHEDWYNEIGGLWSQSSIRRGLTVLRGQGAIIARNMEQSDRTLWYRINYEHSAIREDTYDFKFKGCE